MVLRSKRFHQHQNMGFPNLQYRRRISQYMNNPIYHQGNLAVTQKLKVPVLAK